MPLYPNGRWPVDELAVIPGGTKMGGNARIRKELLPSIVAMQSACYRDTGLVLRPTSAADGYRDLATQERTFLGRYVRFNTGTGDRRFYLGVYWWRLARFASAAVPGFSNHGDAEAVDWADMVGQRLAWMREHGDEYGWENPLWARDNNPSNGSVEPWHWEPLAAAFAVNRWPDMIGQPTIPNPGGTLPAPLEPDEEFDMTADELRAIVADEVAKLLRGPEFKLDHNTRDVATRQAVADETAKVLRGPEFELGDQGQHLVRRLRESLPPQ